MKWGRKQQQQKHLSSSSSSSAFSISKVFPLSWISKLKQKSSKHQPQPQFKPASPRRSAGLKSQPNSKSNNLKYTPNSGASRVTSASDRLSSSNAILQRMVGPAPAIPDDGFLYLSTVGDEDVSFLDGKKKRRGGSFESASYANAVTESEFPFLGCRSDLGMYESRKFTDMISADIRRPRYHVPPPSEKEESDKERRRRRHSAAHRRRIKREHLSLKETDQASLAERYTAPLNPIQTSDSRNSDWKEHENRQFSGARRSFSGKMRQRSKVKVYSPRKASKMDAWGVKASKEKKRRGQKKEEEKKKRLESFAMVKCSYDPQKDFRDSMVEMILEQGIGQPEELESLLACYLSLNSDEYHDVIVKVFRQVWFHLRRIDGSDFH